MDWKLEVIVVPVSDVDRAKEFYADRLGFNVDVDHRDGDFRVVQLTPPGSARRKAIHRPSGENRGSLSRRPWVSRRGGADPSVATSHSELTYWSSSRSGWLTATTAVRPSGDNVGALRLRRRAMSLGCTSSHATGLGRRQSSRASV